MQGLGMSFLGLVLIWMLFRCVNDFAVIRHNGESRKYGTYKEPLNPNQEYYNQAQAHQAAAQQAAQDYQAPAQQDAGIDQQRSVSPQDPYQEARAGGSPPVDGETSRPEWTSGDQPTSFEQDMVHVTSPSPVPEDTELPRGTPA